MADHGLAGKHIVLGVTGSIAAYKSADLIRRLREAGAEIRVVMTKAACEFITPLTLQTLSGHPVATELLDADQESAMGHIALARWADWILVAPCSADTLSRLARGRADDLLSSMILASDKPLALAPAMNNKMWQHPATQDNLRQLAGRGVYVLGPGSGDQACGEQGEGRLIEPLEIVNQLTRWLNPGELAGQKVLITAGPTHEPLDPVRYLANRSSGKMGFALAEAAVAAGAEVTLIAGPVALPTPQRVKRVDVETAAQMAAAVEAELADCAIFIGCAAVADFTPARPADQKIKKAGQTSLQLDLQATTDILASVGHHARRPALVVGFAAETGALETYARDKLQRKNADMIAANDVTQGRAFGRDDNALTIFWPEGQIQLAQAAKTQLARELMFLITERYHAKNTT